MRVKVSTILVSLLALGALVTLIVGEVVHERSNALRLSANQEFSDQIAQTTAASLNEAFEGTASLVEFTEQRALTLAEYQVGWQTAFPFRGDSTSSVIVAVPPEDFDAFVEATQNATPEYTPQFVSENPPEPGHLMYMLTATDSRFLGADLNVVPEAAAELVAIEAGAPYVDGTDGRQAGAVPGGQMRVVRAHETVDLGGVLRQAWTAFQVDTRPIAADAASGMGARGATISSNLTGFLDEVGEVALNDSKDQWKSTSSANAGPFTVTADVWSNGAGITPVSRTRVHLIGSVLTLAALLLGGLAMAVRSLLDRVDRSDRDARRDSLTGLPNRRALQEHLSAHRHESKFVLFADIDRFKVVNDSAGHLAGDRLLVEVAARFGACEDVFVARYGGDEFVFVGRPNCDPAEAAVRLAAELVDAMADPFELPGGPVRVSISAGIATSGEDEDVSADELIREADVALGKCKTRGIGGFILYDETLKGAELDRLVFEADLQRALDVGDFVLHYQPIVDGCGAVVSYEALVRWERDGILLAPGAFLPAVSDIGRERDLGLIVLEQSLSTYARLGTDGPGGRPPTLHVNVDPEQLTDSGFPAKVDSLLRKYNVAPELLLLELTERDWDSPMEMLDPLLRQLADLGVGLVVDDFGDGYSSLARLLAIPGLTEIKIDRSMVRNAVEPRTAALIKGLTTAMQEIDVTVLAEGVETVEELEALKAAGIDVFQGFLFARPGPAVKTFAHRPTIAAVRNDPASS